MSAAEFTQVYRTEVGQAFFGDSLAWLQKQSEATVDLVLTSPPFALQRQKAYGNKDQDEYVEWLLFFAREIRRILKDSGSLILDLGGAYQKNRPVRSLYNYRILIRFCDELGFRLAEEFFWFNPAKLPSPIEWVNKRKIRVKDAVNTVWWFSKTDLPKADVRNVLVPYSDRMKALLKNPEAFYRPAKRPSGHDITYGFGNGNSNGGAIPSNLLQIPNTESNSKYIRLCKQLGFRPHPARFPIKLPLFFIRLLTDPGDLVCDIFAGSNTTGEAAEQTGRRWISCDNNIDYVIASALRFLDEPITENEREILAGMKEANGRPVVLEQPRQMLLIGENGMEYTTINH